MGENEKAEAIKMLKEFQENEDLYLEEMLISQMMINELEQKEESQKE